MSLKHSYTLLAPVYDLIVGAASQSLRRGSLRSLGEVGNQRILLSGVGTGLDLPLLPPGPDYFGVDLTHAMLQRARRHGRADVSLLRGDVMHLPYPAQQFDIVIMHLILAVVPQPRLALMEAERVLRPGGRILILDKFLQPGQWAPLRRSLSLVLRHIATRTDVVFEDLLPHCPQLHVVQDRPLPPGGWFRQIELSKQII